MVGVLIVTDARFYREGLAEALADHAAVRVVGTAADADGALGASPDADVLLLDADLPAAIEATRRLASAAPQLKVVALGLRESHHDVVAWAEAGLAGFVSRDQSLDDLVATVASVARGEVVCPPSIVAALLRRMGMLAHGQREGAPRPADALTFREREIARLIGEGLSNKEIAFRLGIQLSTIKTHVHHILEKLRVRRRVQIRAPARPV